MHKTLATKISIFLISLIFSLFLFSCAEPSNPSVDYKIELQNSMSGTWLLETYDEYAKGNNDIYPYPYGSPETIEISNEYIKFDGSDVSKWEFPSGTRLVEDMINIFNNPNCSGSSKELFFKILNEYQIYKKSDLCMYKYIEPNVLQDYCEIDSFCILSLVDDKLYLLIYESIYPFDYEYYQCIYTQEKKDNSNNDNNNNDNPSDIIDLIGSYTISEANGSTFTFATDGTWTYKYNSRTSEGTWTFADGELTITYSLGGYSNTAVFTVSVSGDTYTLKGKSGDTTTIIASAFKITDQNAVQNEIVTLVKQ